MFAAIVLLLVVAIPAYGFYVTFVAPPRHTVVTVNDVKYSLGYMEKLVRGNATVFAGLGQSSQLGTLPFQILNNIVNEELIRQAAPRLGIVVTQDEVDANIRDQFYPSPLEGQQTDPEALNREFGENYRQYLNLTKFSDSDYREVVRRGLLREKLRDSISDRVPGVEEQVYAHWIRLTDDTVVEEVQNQLAESEEAVRKQVAEEKVQDQLTEAEEKVREGILLLEAFQRIARIHSAADRYADDNGEVGWVPRGAFPDFEPELFSIEHNTISQPIRSAQDTYLALITDGPELLEISEEMRDVLKNQAMEQWLIEELGNNDVAVAFSSDEYEWIINKVQEILAPLTP